MKKIYLLGCILSVFWLSGCQNDEKIVAELEAPAYDVSDSSDPVQHLKHEMFANYQTYLIVNPQVKDYVYNFKDKYNYVMIAPEQSAEVLTQGYERFKKIFLDVYPREFLKNNLPFSIILADSIRTVRYTEDEELIIYMNAFASNRVLAMTGVRQNMENDDEEVVQQIKGDLHAVYWLNYMQSVKQLFAVPDDFYEVSKDNYGESSSDDPKDIDYYAMGFVSYFKERTIYDPDWEEWWTEYPDKDEDLRQWIAFIFSTPQSKLQSILDEYPLMKSKYDILAASFLKAGFDVKTLP